jgi:hypothetical protein
MGSPMNRRRGWTSRVDLLNVEASRPEAAARALVVDWTDESPRVSRSSEPDLQDIRP